MVKPFLLMLINKRNEKKAPTMQECMDSLSINAIELSHLREMRKVGMIKFCKQKIQYLESVPNETDPSFRAFCSLVYDHFRTTCKDKGSKWKNDSFSILQEHMTQNILELEQIESKVESLPSIIDLTVKAYTYYRKLITKIE